MPHILIGRIHFFEGSNWMRTSTNDEEATGGQQYPVRKWILLLLVYSTESCCHLCNIETTVTNIIPAPPTSTHAHRQFTVPCATSLAQTKARSK